LYAYLKTHYARGMMRSTKYGNVIKHLEPEHLQELPVPAVADRIKATLDIAITRCFSLRDEAHLLSLEAESIYDKAIGPIAASSDALGYSVRAIDIPGARRLDAYSHNPLAASIIKSFNKGGRKI